MSTELAAVLSKLKEQFRLGAPYTVENEPGHVGSCSTAIYADDGALVALFVSESDAEVLAEFLNFIAKEGR